MRSPFFIVKNDPSPILAIKIVDFPIRNLPALKPIPLPTSSPTDPAALSASASFSTFCNSLLETLQPRRVKTS